MSTRRAEIFAEPVAQDHLSGDPLVAKHISDRILKAAENAKRTAESERPAAIEEHKIPSTGAVAGKDDVLHNVANPLIRMIVTAYQSDYYPVLLILAIYTLFAFGATLFVLLELIAHIA